MKLFVLKVTLCVCVYVYIHILLDLYYFTEFNINLIIICLFKVLFKKRRNFNEEKTDDGSIKNFVVITQLLWIIIELEKLRNLKIIVYKPIYLRFNDFYSNEIENRKERRL